MDSPSDYQPGVVGNRERDEVVPVMGADVEGRLELVVRGLEVPDGYAQAGAGVTVLNSCGN